MDTEVVFPLKDFKMEPDAKPKYEDLVLDSYRYDPDYDYDYDCDYDDQQMLATASSERNFEGLMHIITIQKNFRRYCMQNKIVKAKAVPRLKKKTEQSIFQYSHTLQSDTSFERYENSKKKSLKNLFLGIRGDFRKKNVKYKQACQKLDGSKYGFCMRIWDDGSVFKGNMVEDKACGACIFKNANGDLFQGRGLIFLKLGIYLLNTPSGFGIFIDKESKTSYQGKWHGKNLEGIGCEESFDTSYYQGEYKGTERHGIGIYRCESQVIYRGQFSHGRIEGMVK